MPNEEALYFVPVSLVQICESLSIRQPLVFIPPLGLFFYLLGRPDTRPSQIPLGDSFLKLLLLLSHLSPPSVCSPLRKAESQQAVTQAQGQDAAVTAGFLRTGEGTEEERGLIRTSQSKDARHLFLIQINIYKTDFVRHPF